MCGLCSKFRRGGLSPVEGIMAGLDPKNLIDSKSEILKSRVLNFDF